MKQSSSLLIPAAEPGKKKKLKHFIGGIMGMKIWDVKIGLICHHLVEMKAKEGFLPDEIALEVAE